MGGIGSGRTYFIGAKNTTDSYITLDVRHLKRENLLQPGISFERQWFRRGTLRLSLFITIESNKVILPFRMAPGMEHLHGKTYAVPLAWTGCEMGGKRPWFLCPATGCGKRVAILYGGYVFACRHCYNLAYPSQRESNQARAFRKADKIRKRLGWSCGIANGIGPKPNNMHWQTYFKFVDSHNQAVHISTLGVIKQIGLMERLLAGIGENRLAKKERPA